MWVLVLFYVAALFYAVVWFPGCISLTGSASSLRRPNASFLALEDELNHSKMKWTLMVLALAAIVVVGGCKKKSVPPTPPAALPAPQPTITMSVSPESIDRGGSATLTWSTKDATDATMDGVATAPSGSTKVSPAASTTYHLTATGPGGSADASARLTVVEPAAPPQQTQAPELGEDALFAQSVKDIYFDYDRYDLRAEDQAVVNADAAFLKTHPSIRFTIEGHCDERGSTDYNLALGDNRANAARSALVQAGVPTSQIRVISFGKEKPFCSESTESCWQQNRRDHFVYGQR
jgi:peptidoglycan-associated lipoprotein